MSIREEKKTVSYDDIYQQNASPREERKQFIQNDINEIDMALEDEDENVLINLHIEIDGKYHAILPGWGDSMYNYGNGGFYYEGLGKEALIHNLKLMRGALTTYMMGFQPSSTVPTVNIQNVNHQSLENAINVNIYQEARQAVENMGALNQKDTEQILEKINELEDIQKEQLTRKKKWERIKPIIEFAMDKGVDVALTILSLVVEMNI